MFEKESFTAFTRPGINSGLMVRNPLKWVKSQSSSGLQSVFNGLYSVSPELIPGRGGIAAEKLLILFKHSLRGKY
jgi:hypothetical protein